jgi:putative effector of murein hydrolase LrgA (UPF0299 family)
MDDMIQGIAWLLGFQLIGETLAYGLGGNIPGPVIGLALLALALLAARRFPGKERPEEGRMEAATGRVADGLLANIGILFVPAGVGIIQHLDIVADLGLPILAAIFLSTIVTLVVTVWAFVLAKRLETRWRKQP